MKRLGKYVTTTLLSYGLLVICISLLWKLGIIPFVSADTLLQYLSVTCLIGALMFLLDMKSGDDYTTARIPVHLLCIVVPVFGLGGWLFGWFPLVPLHLLLVLGICLLIYAAVIGILLLSSALQAEAINQAIRQQRSQQHHTGESNGQNH